MARSIQQQIDDNDAAIARAETSQSYSIRGRAQTAANLSTLYAERIRLAKVAGNPTQMSSVAAQTRPT